MIKTVIFDLGRVLVPFDFKRGYQAIANRFGLVAEEIPARIGATDLVNRYEAGEMDTSTFVERLCTQLGFKATEAEFTGLWSAIFERRTLVPESLPATLRRNGYRVVLLSNTNDMHFRFIQENYPILDHFDRFVLSYKVGAIKPSPKIYEHAIEAAECRPEECFYTDDIAEYVEGAKKQGIDAVQFKEYEQLRRELLARDVRI